jgi:catechol 2,3-dioxygenase-like lactoylglutathione lyase family enzyme
MYSHVTLGTNDMDRAVAFYAAVMRALGHRHQVADPAGAWAGWFTTAEATPDATPNFWVMRPIDGRAATARNGVTIGFEAPDRATVDRFHAAALAHGGAEEGPPGLRPYHAHYYGAYVRDPDGNKLCCVCHRPA